MKTNFLIINENWNDIELNEAIKEIVNPRIIDALNVGHYHLMVLGIAPKWYCINPYMKEKVLKQIRSCGATDIGLHNIEFSME